jgi:uncharacterized membrane protein YeaQ/YmgE (transglycosylase-associated protein family)
VVLCIPAPAAPHLGGWGTCGARLHTRPMHVAGQRSQHRHQYRTQRGRHAAISWALLGLVTGWISEFDHDDEFPGRRRVGTYALGAGGALLGGILGAALGLDSFSLIRFGAWHTAIGGAALWLWLHEADARPRGCHDGRGVRGPAMDGLVISCVDRAGRRCGRPCRRLARQATVRARDACHGGARGVPNPRTSATPQAWGPRALTGGHAKRAARRWLRAHACDGPSHPRAERDENPDGPNRDERDLFPTAAGEGVATCGRRTMHSGD